MDFEQLAELLAGQLQMGGDEGAVAVEKPKVLDELSVDGIVTHLKKIMMSEDKRKVIVMTGAGLSTAAGIPDFRSPGTGLYHNLQKYNLPSPQSVFEIGYFRHNPKPFFDLAKELYPALFKPTLSHYFIRLLAEKGLLLRNFTQNIDTLERRAGIHDDFLVEAHGAFHTAHCIDCGREHRHEYVRDAVFAGGVPMCTRPGCARVPLDEGDEPYHGLVKPDIVFFGEALPDRFAKCAGEDTKKCELLVVIGTSLAVHPFASLVDRVPETCPRLLINLERVGEGNPLMKLLGISGGMDFSASTGYRDVFLQKTCDEGCLQLARMLGWEDELKELCTQHHKQLEKEIQATKKELESAGKTEREDGRQKEEDGRQKEEDGKQKEEEDGRQKEEDGRQKEEDGKQKKEEDGRQNEEDERRKEDERQNEEDERRKEDERQNEEDVRRKKEDGRQEEVDGRRKEEDGREGGEGCGGEIGRSNPSAACHRQGEKGEH